jgi:hypothetical protein
MGKKPAKRGNKRSLKQQQSVAFDTDDDSDVPVRSPTVYEGERDDRIAQNERGARRSGHEAAANGRGEPCSETNAQEVRAQASACPLDAFDLASPLQEGRGGRAVADPAAEGAANTSASAARRPRLADRPGRFAGGASEPKRLHARSIILRCFRPCFALHDTCPPVRGSRSPKTVSCQAIHRMLHIGLFVTATILGLYVE